MKRKRNHHPENARKRQKSAAEDQQSGSYASSRVNHPVLRSYYKDVVTLRTYLCKLTPRLSQRRRDAISKTDKNDRSEIAELLDTVVIATNSLPSSHSQDDRSQDLALFSQQQPRSALGRGSLPDPSLQLEVVDFVIWLLLRRFKGSSKHVHLLCQGFERASAKGNKNPNMAVATAIPGVVCQYPNKFVERLTGPAWCELLSALGRGGDLVMVDLLVDCALFCPCSGHEGLLQVSGVPISQLSVLKPRSSQEVKGRMPQPQARTPNKSSAREWSAVRFVRSRMFYAKPTMNTGGAVRLGLRHIHVLNRFHVRESEEQTVHVMKYIFPRQFGLHNVFTSEINPRETAQAFKDYTLREQEIVGQRQKAESSLSNDLRDRLKPHLKIPKRLRGQALELIRVLRRNHERCPYVELLRHYCPTEVPQQSTATKRDPTALATPHANVSAFCRQVIDRVFPKEFWGSGNDGQKNANVISRNVDMFIRLRKGEGLTLHDVLQDIQISTIRWLRPANCSGKMSQSDFEKRKEILAELVYYVLDSFLIPLIRSNFHVTESNVHRNRLFYFRHDVWRQLTESTFTELKSMTFEEMKPADARKLLTNRTLGYSAIRLLPKATGFRPITNLRRRMLVWQNGKKVLGRSINSILNPTFKVLNFEKTKHPEQVGSSLFSVGDIYPRLKAFSARLDQQGLGAKPLYFAKLDVSACFDTIPQDKMLEVVAQLMSSENYQVEQHVFVKASQRMQQGQAPSIAAPRVKFFSEARSAGRLPAEQNNPPNPNSEVISRYKRVFVGPLAQQSVRKQEVMKTLQEHIKQNLVKIGKKYYRQKSGIPQGSILSSLLCNLFYGQLEREMLVWDCQYLLMRLIDDFLLITPDRQQAEQFMQLLHRGIPAYGVTVKLEKSLANFEVSVDGRQIPRLADDEFPYCGLLIDPVTLDIKKEGEKQVGGPADALTVEYSSIPGRTFHRKALNAFKIKMHAMFLDTSFNSVAIVASNLYKSFYEAAQRMLHYSRCLPKSKQPCSKLIIDTIGNLTRLGWKMMQGRHKTKALNLAGNYQCSVRKTQMTWLCCKAFSDVFQRHQSGRRELVDWLGQRLGESWPKSAKDARLLQKAVT